MKSFAFKMLVPVLAGLFVAEKLGVKFNAETISGAGQSISGAHEVLVTGKPLIASLLSLGMPIVGAVMGARTLKAVRSVPPNTRVAPVLVWQGVASVVITAAGSFLLHGWLTG